MLEKLVDVLHLAIEGIEDLRQLAARWRGRDHVARPSTLGRCKAKLDGKVRAQEHAPGPPLGDLHEQAAVDGTAQQFARAGNAHAEQLRQRLRREQWPVMEEGREPREVARSIFRDDRMLGRAMELFQLVQPCEVCGGACLKAAHGRIPVLVSDSSLQPKRLHAAHEAGQGSGHHPLVAQSEGQREPGQGGAVETRMLADPIERADQRRMVRGYLDLADRGRERVAPGEGVGIAQRRFPGGKAIEQVEVGRPQRPAGDLQPAAPGKYVNFVDLGRLQLQGPGVATPGGAACPGRCHRTNAKPGIETRNGGRAGGDRGDHLRAVGGAVAAVRERRVHAVF